MADEDKKPDVPRTVVTERVVTREVNDPPLGPGMNTEPGPDHFFLASDGKTRINAFGEVIGSEEDRKRKASA